MNAERFDSRFSMWYNYRKASLLYNGGIAVKIVTLIENTQGAQCPCFEHGLSFYIETEKHKLLADTGQTAGFMSNADALGINLKAVDTVVLSHGHYDHSGGIMPFAAVNLSARIYMQRTASGHFYHDERYIGIDREILSLPQVRLLDGDYVIDDELSIFSGIAGRRYWAKSNLVLSRHEGGDVLQDDFCHEQCLVITEGKQRVLVSGCAHNGILNVLDRYKDIYGSLPDVAISGFHMMKKTEYTDEELDIIRETAHELSKTDTLFYTGHCTGESAFLIMKEIMGEQLQKLYSGMRIL